jgi:hypothetical protein
MPACLDQLDGIVGRLAGVADRSLLDDGNPGQDGVTTAVAVQDVIGGIGCVRGRVESTQTVRAAQPSQFIQRSVLGARVAIRLQSGVATKVSQRGDLEDGPGCGDSVRADLPHKTATLRAAIGSRP